MASLPDAAAVAGAVSPTAANKPGAVSRMLATTTNGACVQWNRGQNGGHAFPSPNDWALLPSVVSTSGASGASDAAVRVAGTIAVAVLVLAVNAAARLYAT